MSTYPPRRGTDPQSLRHWAVACVASARVLRAEGHPDQAADLEHAATLAATPPPRPPHHHGPGTPDLSDASNPEPGDDDDAGGAGAFEDAAGQVPSWWR
jgi:hypothetical protein